MLLLFKSVIICFFLELDFFEFDETFFWGENISNEEFDVDVLYDDKDDEVVEENTRVVGDNKSDGLSLFSPKQNVQTVNVVTLSINLLKKIK